MKIWITQWAMTSGVRVVDNAEEVSANDKMVLVPGSGESLTYYVHKPHWHKTRQEAIIRVRSMRNARLRSLQKSISKVSKIDPEEAVPSC